jgi:hypothetical protein
VSLFSNSDVANFLSDRLAPIYSTYASAVTQPSNAYLLLQLQAAEAEIARQLKVYLEPTKLFPIPPTDAQIAALAGMPWDEEPGYDYDSSFFQGNRWGYLVLRHRPLISVDFMQFAYPAPTQAFYDIPASWMRLDKKPAHINLVPAAGSFTAPLSAFMLQAIGGGSRIPFMFQVQYTSGLTAVKTDPRWADLLNLIYKKAAMLVVENHRDMINETLFGAKGSNAGIYTSIHGLQNTIAGGLV